MAPEEPCMAYTNYTLVADHACCSYQRANLSNATDMACKLPCRYGRLGGGVAMGDMAALQRRR